MKIIIYTSELKGSFNTYNISELLTQRGQHEYKFVVVRNKANTIGLVARFKKFVVELRDGRNYLRRDQEKLEKVIDGQCKQIDQAKFSVEYVDQVNDNRSQEIIKNFAPDIILQAGAGILKTEIFSLARIATLNVHHGYAPEIRGIQSTFWCLYYGLTDLIGVTCHKIDANLDTGDVICQYRYKYSQGDTFIRIQEALCKKGAQVLIRSVDLLGSTQPQIRQEVEVDSYYFSKVDYRKYTKLRKNSFSRVEDPSGLKTKKKPKVYCFDPGQNQVTDM